VTALAADIAPVALLEATTEQVAEWVAGYRDRDTQRTHLAAARLFYEWALERDLVGANPVTSLVEDPSRAPSTP
jgi:site-specific recombinase XerD